MFSKIGHGIAYHALTSKTTSQMVATKYKDAIRPLVRHYCNRNFVQVKVVIDFPFLSQATKDRIAKIYSMTIYGSTLVGAFLGGGRGAETVMNDHAFTSLPFGLRLPNHFFAPFGLVTGAIIGAGIGYAWGVTSPLSFPLVIYHKTTQKNATSNCEKILSK